MNEDFWDSRYRESTRIWSGEPNPQLLAEVSALNPGKALDAGCGEGADAIWLAQRGWRVTAVDFSRVALEKGMAEAGRLGIDERIDWLQRDLTAWRPPCEFTLVSAQFLHLQPEVRGLALQHLASAAVSGGTLLVVGHNRSDLVTPSGKPRRAEVLFDPDDIVEVLDAAEWRIEVSEARERRVTGGERGAVMLTDTVVRAVREP